MPEPRDRDQAVPEPSDEEETIPISVDAPARRQRRAPTIRPRVPDGQARPDEDEETNVEWPPPENDE